MQVRYRLIGPSGVLGEQVKDMDGVQDINDQRIESDVYDKIDAARKIGWKSPWVECL